MAKKSGLSQTLYNAIENGSGKNPKVEDSKKILVALGADPKYVDDLQGGNPSCRARTGHAPVLHFNGVGLQIGGERR